MLARLKAESSPHVRIQLAEALARLGPSTEETAEAFDRRFGKWRRDAGARVIGASVPLGEMFGYSTTLRSLSQGRAVYTMQFAHYADVPRNVADEVKAKYA